MSPAGGMSEEERRELIARQRSALYREGPFAESGGYVDENGQPRTGLPGPPAIGPTGLRGGGSPLAFDYGRPPPAEVGPQGQAEPGSGSQSAAPHQRSRANSTASPQSNPAGGKSVFDAPGTQPARTNNSSPGGSPSTKLPGGSTVAPIGTRPAGNSSNATGSAINPALGKRSATPVSSPLSHGFSAPGNNDNVTTTSGNSNPPSANAEGGMGLGWGGRNNSVWGNGKSGLGVQASVWG